MGRIGDLISSLTQYFFAQVLEKTIASKGSDVGWSMTERTASRPSISKYLGKPVGCNWTSSWFPHLPNRLPFHRFFLPWSTPFWKLETVWDPALAMWKLGWMSCVNVKSNWLSPRLHIINIMELMLLNIYLASLNFLTSSRASFKRFLEVVAWVRR